MKLSNLFKNFLPYIILVVFGFLLYYQTLFFSFVYLDDNQVIINNQQILTESGVFKIFTSDVFFSGAETGAYYRPLLNISFLIDSLIGGTDPFIFHFTNLILHLIAACLVFFVFKKYFFSKATSYFLAFLFLVHPALSQTIAWIPARNDLLLTIFVLASFALFLSFLKTNKISYLWGHLVFFGLALFVKETAIFLPLICLAFYYLFDYKFSKEDRANNFLVTFVLWFSTIFIWYLFRKIALPENISLISSFPIIWQNLFSVLVYFGKIIFPFNLGVYPTIKDSTYYLAGLAIITSGLAIYFTKRINWRHFSFGLFWFFIFLIPTILNSDTGLEHRLYLSIIGIFICLAEIFPLVILDWKNKKNITIASLIIIIFSLVTFFHAKYFSDRLSFWMEAAKNSPNSAFVHNNLGSMYYLDANFDKAKEQYEEALKLDPDQRLVHNNLGLIAVNSKDFVKAESEYKQELAINPYYDNAFTNLGSLYFNLKRFPEAKKAFGEAYRLNPNNYDAYRGLLILGAN